MMMMIIIIIINSTTNKERKRSGGWLYMTHFPLLPFKYEICIVVSSNMVFHVDDDDEVDHVDVDDDDSLHIYMTFFCFFFKGVILYSSSYSES